KLRRSGLGIGVPTLRSMRCLQIAIFSLKWKARSLCIWASTAGKPSKTDHLQRFRLAGTECAWEKTNSPANGSSISPGTSAVTRNGRGRTTICGLPPSSCGRIAAQARQRIHAERGASTDAQETAAVRDFSPLYVRFGSWLCENSSARATRRNIFDQLHL